MDNTLIKLNMITLPRLLVIFGLSGFLVLCGVLNIRKGASDGVKLTSLGSDEKLTSCKSVLAPCGEACSYSGRPVPDPDNPRYPQLEKDFDCPSLLARMAYTDHEIVHPPPEQPPADLLDEFTQHGDMPLRDPEYFVNFYPDSKPDTLKFNRTEMKYLIRSVKKDININGYKDQGCMMNTLRNYSENIAANRGVVVGTLSPWLEAMLLAYGAEHITTLEYNSLFIKHPKVEVYKPYTYAAGSHDKFDFGASFSSIEHSGLGRYGDPINPYGDLEAMAQMWCLTKPNGYFFLGVPGSEDDSSYLSWNAHRVYGSKRLQHLTANWRLEKFVRCKDEYIVLVLQRTG